MHYKNVIVLETSQQESPECFQRWWWIFRSWRGLCTSTRTTCENWWSRCCGEEESLQFQLWWIRRWWRRFLSVIIVNKLLGLSVCATVFSGPLATSGEPTRLLKTFLGNACLDKWQECIRSLLKPDRQGEIT